MCVQSTEILSIFPLVMHFSLFAAFFTLTTNLVRSISINGVAARRDPLTCPFTFARMRALRGVTCRSSMEYARKNGFRATGNPGQYHSFSSSAFSNSVALYSITLDTSGERSHKNGHAFTVRASGSLPLSSLSATVLSADDARSVVQASSASTTSSVAFWSPTMLLPRQSVYPARASWVGPKFAVVS